jgi:hypothetical protein
LGYEWVESSDLEPEVQDSNPAKYHDAWRAVVGAGCVRENQLYLKHKLKYTFYTAVFWFRAVSDNGERKA